LVMVDNYTPAVFYYEFWSKKGEGKKKR